jgi:hypothetical protein
MKNHLLLIALFLIATFAFQMASAQYSTKEVKQTLNMKPPKDIRKQAKEYEKLGYKEAVGGLTIERQLTNAWM